MERPGAFERVRERLKTRWEEAGVDGAIPGYRPSSAAAIDRLKSMDGSKAGSGGDLRTMSVGTVGIYYIYAFDGRLLAEYDGYGNCLREYIYIGAKMVAEYQPATGKYYYYTTDQINSTRAVTDDEGNVVYSAAHDPYGGVQQTWVNTFNPEWKFSGKEQDPESSLYYFGARYYDQSLYRFLSPDPVIPADRALYNPQRWNLYGYCLGNPINFVDPLGSIIIFIWMPIKIKNSYRMLYLFRTEYDDCATRGYLMDEDGVYLGYTLELPWRNNIPYKSCIKEDIYKITQITEDIIRLEDKNGRQGIGIHAANSVTQLEGCIGLGRQGTPNGGLLDSRRAVETLARHLSSVSFNGIEEGFFVFEKEQWYLRVMIARSLTAYVIVTWSVTGYII